MSKNESGFAHLAIIGLIVIVLVAGVGAYVYHHSKKAPAANRESTETSTSLTEPLPSDLLTTTKVKELAATEKPGASVTGVELENEEGTYVYKVKLSDGTILLFNAQTGAKITKTATTELDSTITLPAEVSANISFDKAREIALGKQPGGIISKIELEQEEGKLVYSVRFSNGARVDVNAADGTVVRNDAAKASSSTGSSTSGSSSGVPSGSTSSSSGNTSSGSSGSGSGSSGSGSGSSGLSGSTSGSSGSSGSNSGSGSGGGSGHSNDD